MSACSTVCTVCGWVDAAARAEHLAFVANRRARSRYARCGCPAVRRATAAVVWIVCDVDTITSAVRERARARLGALSPRADLTGCAYDATRAAVHVARLEIGAAAITKCRARPACGRIDRRVTIRGCEIAPATARVRDDDNCNSDCPVTHASTSVPDRPRVFRRSNGRSISASLPCRVAPANTTLVGWSHSSGSPRREACRLSSSPRSSCS